LSQLNTGAPVLREEWLTLAIEYLRREVAAKQYTIPYVRVSVGFPLGVRGPKVALKPGVTAHTNPSQCFEPGQTEDGVAQIFISPLIDDSKQVVTHLAHELAHVTANDPSHIANGPYDQTRKQWGLIGRATAPFFPKGGFLDGVFANILVALGPYEDIHAKVVISPTGGKKQATFMKKVFCRCCGDLERRTQTHITFLKQAIAMGAPSCRLCFIGHPNCTGLCKQQPPPPQPGQSSPPPPQDEFDLTPQPPQPSGGGGSGEGEGDESEGEGGDDAEDEGEEGGGNQDKGTGGQGAGSGSGVGEDAPPAQVVMAKGGNPRATVHRKDLCPFGSGCPQCEGDY